MLAKITYEQTQSEMRRGKKLGRLIVEGGHYQKIMKTFYYFYEEEMKIQWNVLGEFIKRVQKHVNEKDKKTLFHVNFIEDVRFEIQNKFPNFVFDYLVKEDRTEMQIFSQETQVATLLFTPVQKESKERLLEDLTDYYIQVKILPTFPTDNKSIVNVNMITRNATILEQSVRKIFNQLDLDSKVNNSFDIQQIFDSFLRDKFPNQTLVKNDILGTSKLDPTQRYSLDKHEVLIDYSREV